MQPDRESVSYARGVSDVPPILSQLPVVGASEERSDAAENRRRILSAARRLLTQGGAEALSMDAVAAEAGVGKGTVFRRFGGRAGLTEALLDDYMREFQDGHVSVRKALDLITDDVDRVRDAVNRPDGGTFLIIGGSIGEATTALGRRRRIDLGQEIERQLGQLAGRSKG